MQESETPRRSQQHNGDLRNIILGLGVVIFIVLGLAFPYSPIGFMLGMIMATSIVAFALVFGLAFLLIVIGKYKARKNRSVQSPIAG